MSLEEIANSITGFFNNASEVLSNTVSFITAIPGYVDWNIALWAGAAGLTTYAILQLRKFYPEVGSFLGGILLSTWALVAGMVIRKRHDDAKKKSKRK